MQRAGAAQTASNQKASSPGAVSAQSLVALLGCAVLCYPVVRLAQRLTRRLGGSTLEAVHATLVVALVVIAVLVIARLVVAVLVVACRARQDRTGTLVSTYCPVWLKPYRCLHRKNAGMHG